MTTPDAEAVAARRAALRDAMYPWLHGDAAEADHAAASTDARLHAAGWTLTRHEDVARRLHHGGWTKGAPRRGEPDRMRLWLAAARDLLEGYQP